MSAAAPFASSLKPHGIACSAEANFTVVLGNFFLRATGGMPAAKAVQMQLAACEKHGLKAVTATCTGESWTPDARACVAQRSPALWGTPPPRCRDLLVNAEAISSAHRPSPDR